MRILESFIYGGKTYMKTESETCMGFKVYNYYEKAYERACSIDKEDYLIIKEEKRLKEQEEK